MHRIKVLIVEDSLFFRTLLEKSLSADPKLEVVAAVEDPFAARDAILRYEPDVMTLDVELPKMSGIEFLRQLIPQYPIPTVVISSLNDNVFEALSAGAVDFVNKPIGLNMEQLTGFMQKELVVKIKIASSVPISKIHGTTQHNNNFRTDNRTQDVVIAIGASTGGTEAIYDVVSGFNKDIPGTLVVQHMPAGFTKMYAERLDRSCAVTVKEAVDGECLTQGKVIIAQGDRHLKLTCERGVYRVSSKPGERMSGHCPSVDVLFNSVAKAAGNRAVGIILTGMGRDGAEGLKKMREAGAYTIGQDESSSVIYGMPKEAYEIGAVMVQSELSQIAKRTYQVLGRMEV